MEIIHSCLFERENSFAGNFRLLKHDSCIRRVLKCYLTFSLKEQLRRKFKDKTLPQALEDLEKLAASNRGNMWFVGERVSKQIVFLNLF